MSLKAQNTNPPCLFPIRGLIDITHTGSWHSCLLSPETLAPFLEFPREWPSFTLLCFGWRHSPSQPADCSGLEKEKKKSRLNTEGCRPAASSRGFFSAIHGAVAECWYFTLLYAQDTAVPSRMSPDWSRSSHSGDQFARMEGIFLYGKNSNAVRRKAESLRGLFFSLFFILLTFSCRILWAFLKGTYFCKDSKKKSGFLPFQFKLRHNAAWAGQLVECFRCISLNARRLKFHFHTNLLLRAYFPTMFAREHWANSFVTGGKKNSPCCIFPHLMPIFAPKSSNLGIILLLLLHIRGEWGTHSVGIQLISLANPGGWTLMQSVGVDLRGLLHFLPKGGTIYRSTKQPSAV